MHSPCTPPHENFHWILRTKGIPWFPPLPSLFLHLINRDAVFLIGSDLHRNCFVGVPGTSPSVSGFLKRMRWNLANHSCGCASTLFIVNFRMSQVNRPHQPYVNTIPMNVARTFSQFTINAAFNKNKVEAGSRHHIGWDLNSTNYNRVKFLNVITGWNWNLLQCTDGRVGWTGSGSGTGKEETELGHKR